MSTKQIVTKKMNVDQAENFILSVQNDGSYYVFTAKHTPYANNSDQAILDPVDSTVGSTLSIYDDMLFGKKVGDTDVAQLAPRYDWQSNTVYTMYDDTDGELFQKQFYACVNVGSMTHVYKCLYNNKGAPSMVEPSGTDVNPFETPEDGYIWKYMCTATDTMMTKFATSQYFPVVANTEVVANSNPGSIEVITVEDPGLGYDNYLTGSFESPSDIKIGGNPYLYSIGVGARNVNDFYNGCIIKITSGAAKDEYRIITDYYISGGQRIIVINDPFDGSILPTDDYEIYPYVYVFDTGGVKQTNCIARAIVNPAAGNSVSKVEILETGSGYRSANAVIIPHPTVTTRSVGEATFAHAALRAIMSPSGGHGSNPNNELGASYVGISVKFIEGEVTTENDYRTVGILKDPLFANVVVRIDPTQSVGSLQIGEMIVQYEPAQLAGEVSVSGAAVTGTNTFFEGALEVGDAVLITNGDTNLYANVTAIASNTSLTLSRSGSLSGGGCTISLLRSRNAFSKMAANSAGQITVTNLRAGGVTTSPFLVGQQSSATVVIDESLPFEQRVTINGTNANLFQTFTQLAVFKGQINTPGFIEDELVTQEAAVIYAQPSARVHSVVDNTGVDNDYMYVTNIKNVFQTDESPDSDGVVSGSVGRFTIKNKYLGWLVPDSGEVLYLENIAPITRANNQSETIKLILEF